MKTFILAFVALVLFASTAYASKEHCVSRTVQTNYNDGLNGAVTTVCFSDSREPREKDKKRECNYETK